VGATPTKNTSAYEAYLRGRAFTASPEWERSNVEGAIRSYQEAVKLDPGFALAWAFLSSEQSLSYWVGFDPTHLAAGKESLDRAVALDSNLPETHLALGYYRYRGLRDFPGALAEFQKAEQGLPNNVDVLKAIGLIQRRMGHFDEAVAAFRRAVELDPRNIASANMLAAIYGAVRHYPEEMAMCDHILALDPSNADPIEEKVWCLWLMGKFDAADLLLANPKASSHVRGHQAMIKGHYAEAADLFSNALKQTPGKEEPEIIFDLGLAQKRAGNFAAARATYQHAVQQLLQKLKKESGDPGGLADAHSFLGIAYAGLGDAASAISEGRKGMAIAPSSEDPFEGPMREARMARIYAMLGNADEAIAILKRWIAVPSFSDITPESLRIDPRWDPIRNDPRFQELAAEKKP
jgi:tetratricopeptide (TPR) repeat protein